MARFTTKDNASDKTPPVDGPAAPLISLVRLLARSAAREFTAQECAEAKDAAAQLLDP